MPAAVGTARYTRRDSGLLVQDRLGRADSTTTLGRAETGQAWTATNNNGGSCVWGIKSGGAYLVSFSGGNEPAAYVETNERDVRLRALVTAFSGSVSGLLLRWQDSNNYLAVKLNQTAGTASIVQNVAGTRSTPTSVPQAFVAGATVALEVVAIGPRIVLLVDGAQVAAASNANFVGATKHGLFSSFTGASAWTQRAFSIRRP